MPKNNNQTKDYINITFWGRMDLADKYMYALKNETPELTLVTKAQHADGDRKKGLAKNEVFNPDRKVACVKLDWGRGMDAYALIHEPYDYEPVDSWFIMFCCPNREFNSLLEDGWVTVGDVRRVVAGWLVQLIDGIAITDFGG